MLGGLFLVVFVVFLVVNGHWGGDRRWEGGGKDLLFSLLCHSVGEGVQNGALLLQARETTGKGLRLTMALTQLGLQVGDALSPGFLQFWYGAGSVGYIEDCGRSTQFNSAKKIDEI